MSAIVVKDDVFEAATKMAFDRELSMGALVKLALSRLQAENEPPRPSMLPPTDFLGDLRRANIDRQAAWFGSRRAGTNTELLFHATELGGEVGEVLNAVKKVFREKMDWPGSRSSVEEVASECADVLICLDKLAAVFGIDLAAATARKFNETSEKVGLPQRLVVPPGVR